MAYQQKVSAIKSSGKVELFTYKTNTLNSSNKPVTSLCPFAAVHISVSTTNDGFFFEISAQQRDDA